MIVELGVRMQTSLLSALESCEGENFSLPSPTEPKSLLSSLGMAQRTITTQAGVADENPNSVAKDSFTVQLVGLDSSRLLTPSDGDWVDIVVKVRITVRSSGAGMQNSVTQESAFVAEIRIAHARLVVVAVAAVVVGVTVAKALKQ